MPTKTVTSKIVTAIAKVLTMRRGRAPESSSWTHDATLRIDVPLSMWPCVPRQIDILIAKRRARAAAIASLREAAMRSLGENDDFSAIELDWYRSAPDERAL